MSDFPKKAEDQVNSMAVLVIGLASTAVLWASIVALQAYFEDTEGEMAAERQSQGRADGVRSLLTAQRKDLNETTRADPQKGTLKRLSIDRAKAVVVRDATGGAPSLIPSLGLLNLPTIPATAGKPALAPPTPVPPPVSPEGTVAPSPEGAVAPSDVAPSDGATEEAAPTGSNPAEAAATEAAKPAPAAGINP